MAIYITDNPMIDVLLLFVFVAAILYVANHPGTLTRAASGTYKVVAKSTKGKSKSE
jgi:hypothetical protein